ncbi:hypothetical protein [Brachybacterium sp. UMB0905]|uniref:hypothetical protein n=1 Tax=Brachybacterium sp. UMB0905 TaxID=2069310 RepID=UPI0011AEE6D5|nr:hypothetical protein [Brachybacterium sp. UMB0905]
MSHRVDAPGAPAVPGALPRRDHPGAIGALVALFVLAIAVTWWRNPGGVVLSSDAGRAPVAVPLLLIPYLATILLLLVMPRGRGEARVIARRPQRVRAKTLGLLVLAHVLINGLGVLLHLLARLL